LLVGAKVRRAAASPLRRSDRRFVRRASLQGVRKDHRRRSVRKGWVHDAVGSEGLEPRSRRRRPGACADTERQRVSRSIARSHRPWRWRQGLGCHGAGAGTRERIGIMTLLARLAQQPQGVWLRRALFQIHLWTGVGVGLYMLMISTTGSAVVFRRELSKALNPVTMVTPSGPRLTLEQLTEAAKKAFPRLEVQRVVVPKNPNQAVEVWLTRGRGVRERLFDPYTGKDLGDTVSSEHPAVKWLVDLHDDLLGG